MSIQVVRPKNRKEFLSKLSETPYQDQVGNPNQVFSEPAKLGQPEQNRAYQTSLKGDRDKDFYIGIKDIDEAVMYYFNNVLKLSVLQNNTKVNVPVIYGTPENWKSVQADGYYRDENGKLMAPLLMFKRASISQNRTLGNKLDGNLVHNLQLFESTFNKRNFYSNFQVLNNRVPESKYVVAVTPDYITVEYSCILWTYFVEQMDKLIESLNFASRSYWGDPNRFQFYSSIETFEDNITYNLGENRAVRVNFNLSLNGYLIPDSINKRIANAERYFGVSQVVFGMETSTGTEEFGAKIQRGTNSNVKPVLLSDSVNNVNNINYNIYNFDQTLANYLDTNKTVQGVYVSPTTVLFANAWLTAPSPLPATSLDNFTFFVNGMYVEPSSIVSFTTDGINSSLVVDVNALGYSFDQTDVIIGSGKFA